MGRQRAKWNKATKFKVAMEAYKADRSVSEIAEEYGVHVSQVHRWKIEVLHHLRARLKLAHSRRTPSFRMFHPSEALNGRFHSSRS
jgi:transposase-like protein